MTLNQWLALALGDAAEFSRLPLVEAFGPCPPRCPVWADLVSDGFAGPSLSLQFFSPVGKDADTPTHPIFCSWPLPVTHKGVPFLSRSHKGYRLGTDPDVHASPQHRDQAEALHQVSVLILWCSSVGQLSCSSRARDISFSERGTSELWGVGN